MRVNGFIRQSPDCIQQSVKLSMKDHH